MGRRGSSSYDRPVPPLLASLSDAPYTARLNGDVGLARSVPNAWFVIGFVRPIVRSKIIQRAGEE